MTINKSDAVIVDFPAYTIHEPRETHDWNKDYVNVRHGDKFSMPFDSTSYGVQWHDFQVSTTVGYALERNECPFKEVKDAEDHGHNDHYGAFGLGSMISSSSTEKEQKVGLSWGQKVKLEGKYFTIEKASNNNVMFKPC